MSFFFLSTSCLWEKEYKEAAKKSIQPDTDLILVPYPFNIFDRESDDVPTVSHYSTSEIKNILLEHGLSWDEFKVKWELDDTTQEFEKSVRYTTHFTQYSYDTDIPIWLHGPKWFHNGIYSDSIHQQHIPSIFAKILNFDFQNKIDLESLQKLFKKYPEKPELIVTVVIDQGGHQLYSSHPNSFPFLKKLILNSAYFRKARVGHLESHTAVGHMAIGTGTYPRDSAIYSNEVYLVNNGKIVPKPAYRGKDQSFDLSELKTLSLADQWDLLNENKPVIISQCYAARASIGMAGHGAKLSSNLIKGALPDKDYVYWEDKKLLSWNTDTESFVLPKSINRYALIPYYEAKKKEIKTHFEANNSIEFRVKLHQFQASEFQARMDGELFRDTLTELLVNTNYGNDGYTDLAYVTLKATDAVGHMYGWESEEANQILKATDDEVRKIYEFLETNFKNRYVLLVTADHGAAPMPEISNGLFLTQERFLIELDSLLPESVRSEKSLIRWITHSQLSLNHSVMREYDITEEKIIEKIKSITVDGKQFFRKIWRRKDLD